MSLGKSIGGEETPIAGRKDDGKRHGSRLKPCVAEKGDKQKAKVPGRQKTGRIERAGKHRRTTDSIAGRKDKCRRHNGRKPEQYHVFFREAKSGENAKTS